MDEYKSRLSTYLSDMVREELEKYDGGFTDEWNDQREKNAEVLGYKLSGKNDIKESAVSLTEGGMGILSNDQADVLQGIVMRNKNKNTKAILNVALKSGYFKGVDKKELLGYIDGARQFVKYMKSHPMESINEKMGPEQYHKYMQYVFDTQFKTPEEKKMKKSIIKKINKGQKKKGLPLFKEERDYKAEYKKYGSSTKAKKYRAELNQYNRKKGTYGNGDGKDASHKGGKIVGFEKESTNRGRAEKSRLKKEFVSVNETIELKKLDPESHKSNIRKLKLAFKVANVKITKIELLKAKKGVFPKGHYAKSKYTDVDVGIPGTAVKITATDGKNTKSGEVYTDDEGYIWIDKVLFGSPVMKNKAPRNIGRWIIGKKAHPSKGVDESVNEAVEPQGNMAKIAKIVKRKQASKLGGVMIDMQSASLLMKLWDAVSDKDKEKMNTLNPKVLTTVIKKLWSRVNLKLPI